MKTIDFAALAAPFNPHELEWRIGSCGVRDDGGVWAQILCYVTARAIEDRLDAVCGPANWKNEFRHLDLPGPEGGACRPNAGVLCGLSLRIDGEWITKWDGAQNTDVEAVKGGLSDAQKRAGVQWGLARYLYSLGDTWADTSLEKQRGWEFAKTKKEGKKFWWTPPADVLHHLADAYAGAAKSSAGTAPEEPAEPQRQPAPKKPPLPGLKIAEAVSKLAGELGESWPPQDFLTEACAPHPDAAKQVWSASDFLAAANWSDQAAVDRVIDSLRKYLVGERRRRAVVQRERELMPV